MAKKKAVAKSSPTKKATKKRTVNKSQAIRDYLDGNPGAKPKEIVSALADRKIKVSPQQVSTIKTKYASNGGSPGRATAARGADKVDVGDLMKAKDFASKVGGVDKADQLLKTLKQLKD